MLFSPLRLRLQVIDGSVLNYRNHINKTAIDQLPLEVRRLLLRLLDSPPFRLDMVTTNLSLCSNQILPVMSYSCVVSHIIHILHSVMLF